MEKLCNKDETLDEIYENRCRIKIEMKLLNIYMIKKLLINFISFWIIR